MNMCMNVCMNMCMNIYVYEYVYEYEYEYEYEYVYECVYEVYKYVYVSTICIHLIYMHYIDVLLYRLVTSFLFPYAPLLYTPLPLS